MNRPIKFRVWTGAVMEYKIMAGYLGHFYVAGMNEKDSACMSDFNTIYNEAAPLMQWTGLLDKKGREIYEGDIVKFKGRNDLTYRLPGEVSIGEYFTHAKEFRHYGVRVKRIDMKNSYFGLADNYCKKYEVIGNAHQNPEFLKERA